MRVKKQNKNEYIRSEGLWIRNPFLSSSPTDINNLANGDLRLLLENETINLNRKSINFDSFSRANFENAIICSDGYMWNERQSALALVPNKLAKVIGVNGSLAKWNMVGNLSDKKRVMSYYVVNNPYQECKRYLPKNHKYYPPLIASTRTNPEFLDEYQERPLFYSPIKDTNYSGIVKEGCFSLDDYRNPICAAISYCVLSGVKKIVLFCCDESFSEERPGAEKMKNGLYQYPIQIKSQRIIDAQLYWLNKSGIKIFDCSSGIEYQNASYIKPEEIESFFYE